MVQWSTLILKGKSTRTEEVDRSPGMQTCIWSISWLFCTILVYVELHRFIDPVSRLIHRVYS